MTKPSAPAEPVRIGTRTTWLQHPDALTVVITQEVAPKAFLAIAVWYACWWGAGAGMAYGAATASSGDERLFLVICLAFWAFFAVRIGKVLAWRRVGKETLRIRAGVFTYKRGWGTWGRAEAFDLADIARLEVVKRDPRKFFEVLDIEPWIIGGESLHLRYRGRTIPMALQLNAREAAALASVLDKAIAAHR